MKTLNEIVNEAKKPKMEKVYRLIHTHYPLHGDKRTYTLEGSLRELIDACSYTLEVGESWQHEKGNKKINRNPKNMKALCTNLENAKNNAARNGYSGDSYDFEEIGEREVLEPNPDSNVKEAE